MNVAGRLDASAPKGGDGGTIETSGDKVSVAKTPSSRPRPRAARKASGCSTQRLHHRAAGGDITGAELSDDLNTTNVTILSTQGSGTDGNINVKDTVTWSGGATLQLSATNSVNVNAPISWTDGALTLNAGQNVNVNAVMTASGAGNFAANYGYVLDPTTGNPTSTQTPGTNPDGTPYGLYAGLASNGGYAGQIAFSNSSGAVTLNGQSYTVINSAGDLATAGNNPSGNYVLGSDIALSSLADIPTFTGNYNGFGHSLPVSFATALSVDAPLSIPSLQNTNVVLIL